MASEKKIGLHLQIPFAAHIKKGNRPVATPFKLNIPLICLSSFLERCKLPYCTVWTLHPVT